MKTSLLFLQLISLPTLFLNCFAQAMSSPPTAKPPEMFIDKGACPFECCTYREWTVKKDTELFDKVGGTKIVGKALKGTQVMALTGEVHTAPFKMTNPDGKDFYLLTYLGEGLWKIWQDGLIKSDVPLDFELKVRPSSTWWVQIKLPDGTIGWTKKPDNFGNIDSCG